MEVKRDFKELLELLNSHEAEFLIVGAYALAYHGVPRYTGDIDIFVRPNPENAKRVMSALDEFGLPLQDVSARDFEVPRKVIRLGVPPVCIDLLTIISGLTWEEAAQDKQLGEYAGVEVYYIGREQLIANKRATGRKKDLGDIEALGEE